MFTAEFSQEINWREREKKKTLEKHFFSECSFS